MAIGTMVLFKWAVYLLPLLRMLSCVGRLLLVFGKAFKLKIDFL
jgi:hypothetical protein